LGGRVLKRFGKVGAYFGEGVLLAHFRRSRDGERKLGNKSVLGRRRVARKEPSEKNQKILLSGGKGGKPSICPRETMGWKIPELGRERISTPTPAKGISNHPTPEGSEPIGGKGKKVRSSI